MTDPAQRLREAAETYRAKEDDYGQSWLKVGDLIWTLANEEPIVLESPQDIVRFGLYTRRLDKISGAFNGDFVKDEELTFEDAANRHEDEGTYAYMHSTTYDHGTGGEQPMLHAQIISDAAGGATTVELAVKYGLPESAIEATVGEPLPHELDLADASDR